MHISHAQIFNYRALQSVSIPLNQFSVLLGENDVGKTSFIYALNAFFQNIKIRRCDSYFKRDTTKNISITLSFDNLSPLNYKFELHKNKKPNNTYKAIMKDEILRIK